MFQLTSFLIIYLKYSTVTPNFHLFSHFSTMNIVIKKCKNANELDLGLRISIFFFHKTYLANVVFLLLLLKYI